MSEGESEKPSILIATKRGKEASGPLIIPFEQIHNEIISDSVSEERREELKKEIDSRVREMEELDIVKWRDERAGVLNVIKESKWDDVYSDLIDYAKRAEDETRGVNVRLPEREKYNGVVQAAVEMAALEVSTQGMRRVGKRPDFTIWLAGHGKTSEELKEDEEVVRRGKILDFGGIELPDLVGQELSEAEVGKVPDKETKHEEKEIRIDLVKQETLTPKEKRELDDLEKDWLGHVLKKYMRPYVKATGDNDNLYPYKEQAVDSVSNLAEEYARQIEDEWARKNLREGESVPERVKIIAARLETLAPYIKANGKNLLAAGLVGHYFFDGFRGMEEVLKLPHLRYDGKMDPDMFDLFSSLSSESLKKKAERDSSKKTLIDGEWKLAEEIIRKQNESYSIMRSIAAAHRHSGRNGGKGITPQLRAEGKDDVVDYAVNDKQIRFIEAAFGAYKEVTRTDGKGDEAVEVTKGVSPIPIKAIDKIVNGREAREELEGYFKRQGDGVERSSVVIGRSHEITRKTVRALKNNPSSLGGEVVWIDGTAWPITKETRDEVIEELRWRIGSGDQVFVGKEFEVGSDDYKKKVKKGAREVAMIREIPPALDNQFVATRTGDQIEKTNKKISWMLNQEVSGRIVSADGEVIRTEEMSLWESLKRDDVEVDVEAAIDKFNDKLKKGEGWQDHEPHPLDEHINDMTRIGILGVWTEGAELGWGFEYETRRIGGRKAKVSMDMLKKWEELMQRHEDIQELESYTAVVDGGEKDINDRQVLADIRSRLENNEKVEATKYTVVNVRDVSTGSTKEATDYGTVWHMLKTNALDAHKHWGEAGFPLTDRQVKQILAHEPGWRPKPNKDGEWRIQILGKSLDIGIPAKYDMSIINAIKTKEDSEHAGKSFAHLVMEGTDMSELPYKNVRKDAINKNGYVDWSQQYLITTQLKNSPDARIGNQSALDTYYGPVPVHDEPISWTKKLNKRLSLAGRNLGGESDVEKWMSFLEAKTLAWRMNLLISSPSLGSFDKPDVTHATKNTSRAIRGVATKGDYEGGVRKAERFDRYMKQFLEMGYELNRASGKRKSLQEIINEEDQKLTKV